MTNQTMEGRIKSTMAIKPAAHGASTITSAAIDLQGFNQLRLKLGIGTMATNATLDTKLTECDTSGGSYTDAVDDAAAVIAFAQKTEAGSDSNTEAQMLVRTSRLKRFVKVVSVVAVAAAAHYVQADAWAPESSARAETYVKKV